jgi:hypothetical protein
VPAWPAASPRTADAALESMLLSQKCWKTTKFERNMSCKTTKVLIEPERAISNEKRLKDGHLIESSMLIGRKVAH